MKCIYFIGAGLGLLVGLVIATLMRPALPMLGQPPLDVAFKALVSSGEDFGYRATFCQGLALWSLIFTIAGGTAAFMVEKLFGGSAATGQDPS